MERNLLIKVKYVLESLNRYCIYELRSAIIGQVNTNILKYALQELNISESNRSKMIVKSGS